MGDVRRFGWAVCDRYSDKHNCWDESEPGVCLGCHAFTPNGAKAYVGEGVQTGGYVAEVDTTTFEIKSQIVVGAIPECAGGHAQRARSFRDQSLRRNDFADRHHHQQRVTQTIMVGGDPWGAFISSIRQ